jgi:hypothetical protein
MLAKMRIGRSVASKSNAKLSLATAAAGASRSIDTLVLIQCDLKSPQRQQLLSIMRQARIKSENDRKAAEALEFADWYQDPTIPKNVKAFAMVAARVISLQQRCPSSKSHDDRIARWASDAGVKSSDIEPGGRYASLMTMMLASMQSGSVNESAAEACEAIKKYD